MIRLAAPALFLLGAYQKLLDWHLDYYHHHSPAEFARQKNPPIRQIVTQNAPGLFEAQPAYRLTISERKRILLNNIFGVDIDAQAVEVTKLSLLLKCLEGETSESVQSLLKFMRQRALPDLDNNIKRGNSLIAPDFYDPTTFPDIRIFRVKSRHELMLLTGTLSSSRSSMPAALTQLSATHLISRRNCWIPKNGPILVVGIMNSNANSTHLSSSFFPCSHDLGEMANSVTSHPSHGRLEKITADLGNPSLVLVVWKSLLICPLTFSATPTSTRVSMSW